MEYEALVKFDDNETSRRSGKTGDIAVARPVGWKWGKLERKHFVIVNVGEMTPEAAQRLSAPIAVRYREPKSAGKFDEEGVVEAEPMEESAPYRPLDEQLEILRKRRYYVDIAGLLHTVGRNMRRRVLNREIEAQPFKQRQVTVLDKLDRPEVAREVAGLTASLLAQGKQLIKG